MKHKILSIGLILVFGGIMSIKCFAQNKLTRNQILDAVRTHQQDIDSVSISIGDSVICDSTTTKITLDVMNDSLAHNYSYRLIFSKKDIEVDVYNDDNYLYRSVFEYTDFTYENLKAKINKYNIMRISLRWYRCSGRMVPRGAEPWYRSYRSDGTGTKCPLYTLSKGALQIVLQGTLS